jgi:hypothetical protein
METNTAIVLGFVAVFAFLVVAIVFMRKRSADRLRLRFGPEYERTVEAAGGRHKAQAELQHRQKRVRSFAIKSLTSEEREHYMPLWGEVQTQFVDDPKTAVIGADQLLAEVITHRGYPAGEFEQRSADLSVDHPIVVQNYRTAHDIALRDANGEASTEDLRQAMLSYRALFTELVGQSAGGETIIEAPIEDEIPVSAEPANDEPGPAKAALAPEVMIDEPAPAVQPALGDKSANAPEPISA